jgi:hypothetical protein
LVNALVYLEQQRLIVAIMVFDAMMLHFDAYQISESQCKVHHVIDNFVHSNVRLNETRGCKLNAS